jgi:hypothetical protein
MKKQIMALMVALIAMPSCNKTSSTTSNNTISPAVSKPEFLVNGLTDITFTTFTNFYTTVNVSVQYVDSAQENVSLSYSGFPAGMGIDTTNMSGFPDFTSTLSIIDTGAIPGAYPITLTAVTPSGNVKKYSFNLNINPMPTAFLGKYTKCSFKCSSSDAQYTDSIYTDPSNFKKIWFSNFGNTGNKAYGLISFDSFLDPVLNIPAQTIGGNTYSGSTNLNATLHGMDLVIHTGSSNCVLQMQ